MFWVGLSALPFNFIALFIVVAYYQPMSKLKKRGRKPTNRQAVLYARVQPGNQKWFISLCKKHELSTAEGVDRVLSYLKKQQPLQLFEETA